MGIRNLDLQISGLVLYYLNYPGSNDSTGLNLSPEINAMQIMQILSLYLLINLF